MVYAPPGAAAASLDPDDLVAEACRRAGEPAGRPLSFLPALHWLTAALDTEAGLTDAGRARVHAALVGQLVTQFNAARLAPVDRVAGSGPTFITGLHRTGTTLLQNLLAEHPDVRAPRLWELLAPAAEHRWPWQRAGLVRGAWRYVTEYHAVAPAFQAIHPLDATRPEECHRLTGVTFTSEIYSLRYRVTGYTAWLRGQDRRDVYRYHRTLLNCLLRGGPAARAVVLKCPSHLWHLDELAAAYPTASVVRLHREPEVCIPSVCGLTAVVRAARSSDVDKTEIGAYWLAHAARVLDAPDGDTEPANRILDIRYRDLVADPVRTANLVCEFAGIPRTSRAEHRMRRFLARNPQGKHGTHRYSAAEFGLSTTELRERFAGYRAKFDL